MPSSFTIVFSTSYALSSTLIRFLCHSPFSHADIMLPGPPHPYTLFGASDPGGVKQRPHDYQLFKAWRQATITTPLADKIVDLVRSQEGKPFDSIAMKHVLSDEPRDWKVPDAWFCSELICWACEEAGLFKVVVPKDRVTPSDLLLLLNPWIDGAEFWASSP
jgi:hypothetical protein